MYNVCDDLHKFYDEDLRLGDDRRKKLAEVRDTNLQTVTVTHTLSLMSIPTAKTQNLNTGGTQGSIYLS